MLRARLSDQRGFTLPEVLVSAAAGSVIAGAILILVQFAMTTQVDATARTEAVQTGRQAVNEITQSIKAQTCLGDGSAAFTSATTTSLRFYASVAAAGSSYQEVQQRTIAFVPDATGDKGKITLTIERSSVQPPSLALGAPTTRTIVNGVKLIPGVSLFRYYTFELIGGVASPTLELIPSGTSSLSAGDLFRIIRVDIAFRTTAEPATKVTPDMRFENSAVARTADPDAKEGTLPCA